MPPLQIFLSVVIVVRNQSDELPGLLTRITDTIKNLVQDYELIVVDNGSIDSSIAVLKQMTGIDGLPNLQIFALTKETEADTAFWVGCENALGDYVAVFDPQTEDISFLPRMLEQAVAGADVVFANNLIKPRYSFFYRLGFNIFQMIYRLFNKIHLAKEAPSFRLLSRKVINFILQHPQPPVAYRHIPVSGGFARVTLEYHSEPSSGSVKHLRESIQRGMRLIVATTHAPMRLATALSLFGAGANLLYSIYVVAVGLLKENVAPGWVSLSLQQSGMFFLFSVVLLVLAEYILHMMSVSSEGPKYHIAQEFTSVLLTREEKLNIEEAKKSTPGPAIV